MRTVLAAVRVRESGQAGSPGQRMPGWSTAVFYLLLAAAVIVVAFARR
jgi:hypothetical protein